MAGNRATHPRLRGVMTNQLSFDLRAVPVDEVTPADLPLKIRAQVLAEARPI